MVVPSKAVSVFFELENDDDVNIADLVVSVELFCRGGTQKSVPIKASTPLPGGEREKKLNCFSKLSELPTTTTTCVYLGPGAVNWTEL